jgi:hypothetical protein
LGLVEDLVLPGAPVLAVRLFSHCVLSTLFVPLAFCRAVAAAVALGLLAACMLAIVSHTSPSRTVMLSGSQLGFLGGAGVEGGQGNSDSIYGSHDDHSTYGRSGSGWQGPGNGEANGNLWNPAVGQRRVLPVQNQQNQLQQEQYVMVPLQGQQQQQAAVAAGYPIYSMGNQDMSPLALGFDDEVSHSLISSKNSRTYSYIKKLTF